MVVYAEIFMLLRYIAKATCQKVVLHRYMCLRDLQNTIIAKKLPVSIKEQEWGWNKAEANILPSPWQSCASGVTVGAGGRTKGVEQPDASATATLRRLPEAGSSTAERWPQRKRLTWQPHCALSSPGSSMCRTPPSLRRRMNASWSNSLHANPFPLNKPVHNNWELEGDEIIIIL